MVNESLLEQRLKEFQPKLLVEIEEKDEKFQDILMVDEGLKLDTIDLAKANYLNILNDEFIKKISQKTIREYGVGTCGPRAFYGTTDVHLALEQKLATFLGKEEAIVYSYGFVAIASAIAAYCKPTDYVFIDAKANRAIIEGVRIARSKIITFQHNDHTDFECVARTAPPNVRKFLIIESISWATGQCCHNLNSFLCIAEQHCARVFLDETYTLGVVGKNGRGLLDLLQISPERVDMIIGTLEGAVGSIGGFAAASSFVIDPQRLSGSGYMFSASQPTYLVQVAIGALDIFEREEGERVRRFRNISEDLHDFLVALISSEQNNNDSMVISDRISPFKLITLGSRNAAFHNYCKEQGVWTILKDRKNEEKGVMINVNVSLGDKDGQKFERLKKVIKDAMEFVNK